MVKKTWKLTVLLGSLVLLCGCNEEKLSTRENSQIINTVGESEENLENNTTEETNSSKEESAEEKVDIEKPVMNDYSDDLQESEKNIKVYFSEEVSQENKEQIERTIEKEPTVDHIEQAGSSEAWQEFTNKYFQGSASSDTESPFSDDYSYFIVHLKKNADCEALMEYIKQLPYISSCTLSE